MPTLLHLCHQTLTSAAVFGESAPSTATVAWADLATRSRQTPRTVSIDKPGRLFGVSSMVLRSVVGAVAAVAVIGALAAAVPERPSGPVSAAAKVPPFGAVPKDVSSSAMPEGVAATSSERQALLRLAAYSDPKLKATPAVLDEASRGAAGSEVAAQAAFTPAPLSTTPQSQSLPPVASLSPSTVVAPAASDPAPSTSAPTPATVSRQQVATRSPDPDASARPGPGLVNINKASIAELDHLPGGGRIGSAIARRRPYRSVEDLVRKRVLRDAAFERIKSAITVD